MNKNLKIFGILVLIAAVFVFLISQYSSSNRQINWQKNFDPRQKSPYGLYIFNQEADKLLHDKLKRTGDTPTEYFDEKENSKPQNIVLIEKEYSFEDSNKILEQVKNGSDLIYFSEYSHNYISDPLSLVWEKSSYSSKTLHLTDITKQKDSLVINQDSNIYYISQIPDTNAEILGYASLRDEEGTYDTNFVKVNYGKGHIYVCSEPVILTNYYLLRGKNYKFVEDVFSYLPNRETIWFEDHFNGEQSDKRGSNPALSFIWANPPLKYAFLLLLLGTFLFMLFNAKRRQRIIPVIRPLENTSVEFVKSISNLYLQEGDFHEMMTKKATYFLNKVRNDLLIDTSNLDESFAQKLHQKTGKDMAIILQAIELIKKSQDPYSEVMQEDLIKMNKILDEIYT